MRPVAPLLDVVEESIPDLAPEWRGWKSLAGEFEKLVEKYIDNLIKRFGGEA